jgi:hypothetical protein
MSPFVTSMLQVLKEINSVLLMDIADLVFSDTGRRAQAKGGY